MAEIRVNNVAIPVPSLIQRIRTGIFVPDLVGEYSFPVSVRLTEPIALALGLPSDPQSATDYTELIPAELYLAGNRLYRGKLDVLEANEQEAKLSFVLASGFFIRENKDLTVRECYPETDTILLDPSYEEVGGYRIRCGHGDARLTVNGNVLNLAKDDYEDQEAQLNAIAEWLKGLSLALEVTVLISTDPLSSASYVDYWDTSTATTAEMVQMPNEGVNRSYIATPKTGKRLLMGDYNTADDANRVAFPMLYNLNLYEGANPLFDGVVNRYDDAGRLDVYNPTYASYSGAMQWQNTVMPLVYLTDVMRAVFAQLNIQVGGEFFDDALIKQVLLYNNRPLDFVQVINAGVSERRTATAVDAGDTDPEQTSRVYRNVFDFQIKLSRHVPNVPVLDFLKAVKNTFFLKYDFNLVENQVNIRLVRSVIRGRSVLDLTDKVERSYLIRHGKKKGLRFRYEDPDALLQRGADRVPNPDYTVDTYPELDGLDAAIDAYAYVRSLGATFRLEKSANEPVRWVVYAFDLQNDGSDAGAVEWPLTLGPIADAYYEGRKMPSLEMAAFLPDYNLFNNDAGLRMTVYYGQDSDASGRSYAFASGNRYDASGDASASQWDLNQRSATMAYYYADLEKMMAAPRYRVNALLSEADRYALNETKLIRIGNVLYLLDEMELLLTEGIQNLAKLDLYKVVGS